MSLYKAFRSLVRRVRSVLILAVTILLLFYYTFENEIDMLNSFAENEYIPSIKDVARNEGGLDLADIRREGVLKDEPTGLDPTDLKALREKNKYFPLLISDASKDPSALLETSSDLDPTKFASHKERYPVLNEVSLPVILTPGEGSDLAVQSSVFEDEGVADEKMLRNIKELFVNTWKQEDLVGKISEFHWPMNLIDALDTLYILKEEEEFESALNAISEVTFSLPPASIEAVDISDVGSRALGGLMSGYELSGNATLLQKAKEVADFSLRAYDTPNRLPLLNFFWKSKLDNRFPYQKANAGALTSMTLELIKLSQITQENKYFDAAQRIYRTISLSTNEFDLEYLFPNQVDASGCTPISTDQIQLGRHLSQFKGMKSIDENLQFIHCHQTGKLISFNPKKVKQEQHFDMDAQAQLLYSNLVKSYHLLNGNDLLKFSDNYFEPNDDDIRDDSKIKNSPSGINKNKEKAQSSRHIFTKAMDSVRDLMAFNPATPLKENITLLSSLKTRTHLSPATNEVNVEITRMYDMKFERCSLASTLALGSKLFNMPTFGDFANDLATGCFHLIEEFGGFQPVELYLDPCENEQCNLDVELKVERTKNGHYYRLDSDKAETVQQDEIKVSQQGDVTVPPRRVLAFAYKQGPSFFRSGDLEVDTRKLQWKDDPRRPLWVNKMGQLRVLSPDAVEAIFYLYRTTGDAKWRQMARTMFQMTLETLQNSNGGAKGVWKINELYDDGTGLASSSWLSKTLKYYFLLFSDKNYYSLDDYVFTSGGHLLRKAEVKS
ncbi:putative mannosidase MNL2 TDEL_0C00640 [Torulaspora delbrueckii]|uniref:alpha-1,2-Mannosidase n=1 Tax=Torulaspora delbrueckii TaxID=4950 RepID=G8ZR11_TORDE|nr:hypothetical protein TDEL_0C00640 [Torulaspora delbrueckii]CCE90953.1 hypothetical protein TDEL_0C00640 [Torulaspora delbrueckii]